MKKVLFFALFLAFLGAASVSAQVRIGGNATPHPAAILDLNASDAAGGTLGLSLPRVDLGSETAQLNGTDPKDGTLVYNTGTTLAAGLYYWVTNKWVKLTVDGGGSSTATNVIVQNVLTGYTPAANVFSAQQTVIIGFGPSAQTLKLPDLTAADKGKIVYVSARVGTGGIPVDYTACSDTDGTTLVPGSSTVLNKTALFYIWCGTYWTNGVR